MVSTNSEYDFEAVIGRLKSHLKMRTDAAIAELLGMSATAFNNRKKAGSIPYEEIVSASISTDVDLVFVFTGTGARAVAETDAPYGGGLNADLLHKVICAVEKELGERELEIPAKKKADVIAYLYDHFTDRGVVDEQNFKRFMQVVLEQ